jgi:hypothetical protein
MRPGKQWRELRQTVARAFPEACNAAKRSGRRSGTQRQKLPRSGAEPTFAERRAHPGGRNLSRDRAFVGRTGWHAEPERDPPRPLERETGARVPDLLGAAPLNDFVNPPQTRASISPALSPPAAWRTGPPATAAPRKASNTLPGGGEVADETRSSSRRLLGRYPG